MLDGFCVDPSEAGVGPALQHSDIPAVHISCFQKCLLLELISVTFKERHIYSPPSLHSPASYKFSGSKLTQPCPRRRGPSSLHTNLNYLACAFCCFLVFFFLILLRLGQVCPVRTGLTLHVVTTTSPCRPMTLQPN